jgi:hypothetical protein
MNTVLGARFDPAAWPARGRALFPGVLASVVGAAAAAIL